jgi:hypothetical protein
MESEQAKEFIKEFYALHIKPEPDITEKLESEEEIQGGGL